MTLLVAAALFVSAFLLFWVQPLVAKMILPLLGGTPAVWNTCMLFFQMTLLAGYAYAHAAPRWLGARRHALLHLGVVLVPLAVLPIALGGARPPHDQELPVGWLLGVLAGTVGLPFFVLATSAPLLQSWFAQSGRRGARDPYFLYAASNLGSLLALVGYPTLLEPRLRLGEQSVAWTAGYVTAAVLIAFCAMALWRASGQRREATADAAASDVLQPAPPAPGAPRVDPGRAAVHLVEKDAPARRPTLALRLRWVFLAFVPSSLMLGVTTYLTTDIAAIPLLWVVPLALYLLTFVIAFANVAERLRGDLAVWFPALALLLVFTLLSGVNPEPAGWLLLHLTTFFLAALMCHAELARLRPAPEHLTEFYLWMSVGGALGGLFNGLAAPMLFDSIAEYPLALVLACAAVPAARDGGSRSSRRLDFLLPLGLGAGAAVLLWAFRDGAPGPRWLTTVLTLAVPLLLCFLFIRRPLRFALGLAVLFLVTGTLGRREGHVVHSDRTFFGVIRVTDEATGRYRRLLHGNTLHGQQSRDPERALEPLTYYHRSGPVGDVFQAVQQTGRAGSVALIGLGTGSLASYGHVGQQMTFYEIDPAMVEVAKRQFTFLRGCAADVTIVLGDARLRLAEAPSGEYGLIVVDAFSSDAIPVHLITREAVDVYLDKLSEGGVLAFHVSNRFLRLAPVLAGLAKDASLEGRMRNDRADAPGKSSSIWIVLARRQADLGTLRADARWTDLAAEPTAVVWSDDFSNLVGVFRWKW